MEIVRAEYPRPAEGAARAVGQLEGEVQVDCLVVVHRPPAELEETQAQRDDDDSKEGGLVPTEGNDAMTQRRNEFFCAFTFLCHWG